MQIRIPGAGSASLHDIVKIERTLCITLSPSYRAFLAVYDGAKPERNCFDVGENDGSEVRTFIPAAEILRQRRYIWTIPPKAYPISYDSCGNFAVIDEGRGGAVFFWEHETDSLTEVACDFLAFLEILRPFDQSSVILEPGQNKRVWVDPEFRRLHPELFKECPPTTSDPSPQSSPQSDRGPSGDSDE